MKINGNQTSPNLGGVTGQSVNSHVQVQKQEKTAEGIRDTLHKSRPEPGTDEKQLIEAIEKTNKAIEGTTCSFEYSIHEQTKQIMVKVIDKKTKDVIREFPPEKILDMVAKMWEVAGIIVDERR